jgi:hypothetical protein
MSAVGHEFYCGTNLICDYSFQHYFFLMCTVAEVKTATERLSAEERWELYRWLGESRAVQRLRHEELEIATAIEEANRGDLAPLNVQDIKGELRRRTSAGMFRRNN